MFYEMIVFLLCDFYDFHLFFVSVILLLKVKKCKILFDYCTQKEYKCF
jgi:hypothetical protein